MNFPLKIQAIPTLFSSDTNDHVHFNGQGISHLIFLKALLVKIMPLGMVRKMRENSISLHITSKRQFAKHAKGAMKYHKAEVAANKPSETGMGTAGLSLPHSPVPAAASVPEHCVATMHTCHVWGGI